MEKTCSACSEAKTLECFGTNRRYQDSLSRVCKVCVCVRSAKYRQAHPAELAEANRQWRQANAEANASRVARWREKNSDRVSEYNAHHHAQNADAAHERNRRWRQANPAGNVAKEQRRRARLKGSGGSYTAQEWTNLCNRYGNRCLCCGEAKPLTVDHVIPVARGGLNTIDNLQCLCKRCNNKKYDKTLDYRPAFV